MKAHGSPRDLWEFGWGLKALWITLFTGTQTLTGILNSKHNTTFWNGLEAVQLLLALFNNKSSQSNEHLCLCWLTPPVSHALEAGLMHECKHI